MSAHKKLRIGLAGLGTIGSGVVETLRMNREALLARAGCELCLDAVAERNADAVKALGLDQAVRIYSDCLEMAGDPDLDVLIELMGGIEAPHAFIKRALENRRHVVTANKAMLAENGLDLFILARERGVALRYEASVAGGIPIVSALRNDLSGNVINSIQGILNGTSNYILTEMSANGSEFAHALTKAQQLGIAEADPTLDIDGHDAAHKMVILIRLAWGVDYPYACLPVQGIRNVESMDLEYAREFGFRIKLLGQARMMGGKLVAGVFPSLVPVASLLANVEGSYNAVLIEGNTVGSLFMHGRGAGSLPTASAVTADLVALARATRDGKGICGYENTGFVADTFAPARILPVDEAQTPWYIRVMVPDSPGVLRDVAGALAAESISIAQAIQKGDYAGRGVPLVVTTHQASFTGIKRAVEAMRARDLLLSQPAYYSIME
jgi:homoserine dehydrogenase